MTRDGSTSIRTDLQVSGLSQRIRATEAPRSGTEAMMRRRHARYSLTRWRRSSIKESMQDTAGGASGSAGSSQKRKKSHFSSFVLRFLPYLIAIPICAYAFWDGYRDTHTKRPGQGYYVFRNTYDDGSVWDDLYYYLDSCWYYFDDEYDDWYVDSDFDYSYDDVDDYYMGSYYSSLDGYYDGEAWDFDDTSYYQNYVESKDKDDNYYDDDDDDSWDSFDWGDWDSNDSDWDSDW